MNKHGQINYAEYPAADLERTKAFFKQVFAWQFKDFGSEYTAFSGSGLKGGFFHSELKSTVKNGGALLVFFSDELEKTLSIIENAGGQIVRPIFTFPGGRRFHFTEPSGNEFAVWSDK
ncbi:MAG: glyoxalase [Gammaproteobacteria bacterium]|nr:MAG: glyoxalase [Gammaproteobacteria bacterium]